MSPKDPKYLSTLESLASDVRLSISAMSTLVESVPELHNYDTAKAGLDIYRVVALDLERPITNLAIAAHKAGYSWSSIGASLGISEDVARDLFSEGTIEPGGLARHLDSCFDTTLE